MVRRRGGRRRAITRYVTRKAKGAARRPRRDETKKFIKKATYGTVAGLAVTVPLSFAARYFNMPELFEVGERAGAVAATHFGGTAGQIGFQTLDAVVERVIPSIAAGPGGGVGRLANIGV